MSAWIVDAAHIDYLISAGHACRQRFDSPRFRWDGGELGYDNENEVGQMLWNQNHRSVFARYGTVENQPAYEARGVVIDPVQALKALACYEYQSCETPDWPTTDAYRFCDQLRRELVPMIPGYEEAEWAILRTPEEVTS